MLHAYLALCQSAPGKAMLLAALVALGVQMVIDARLGDIAEYFNAWHVVTAAAKAVRGDDPLAVNFLVGQRRLGQWALPVAVLVMTVQPLVYGGLIVLAGRLAERLTGA